METFIPLERDSLEDFRPVSSKVARRTQLEQVSKTALLRKVYRQSDSCMDYVEVLIMTSCILFLGTGAISTTFPTYRSHYFISFGNIVGHSASIITICAFYFVSGLLEITCSVLLFFCINYYSTAYARKLVIATIAVSLAAAVLLFTAITMTFVTKSYTKDEIIENLRATFPPNESEMSNWDSLQSKLKCCGVHNATEWNATTLPNSCCIYTTANNTCKYAKKGCAESLYTYFKESVSFYHGLSWINLTNIILTIPFLFYLVFQKRQLLLFPERKTNEEDPEDKSEAEVDPSYSTVLQSLTKFLNDVGVKSPKKKKPRRSLQIF